jgi:hypothetical protein
MEQTEITAAVRRAIKEMTQRRVTDTQIENVTLRAVTVLGLRIKEKDPSYYNGRVSLTSYSNVFAWPSGCKKVVKVWDYGGSAIAITGAADNGSGAIRMTAVGHGYSDGAIVTQHDVGGCTESNGTWQIDYVDANTYDLLGSTYSNAYTSGGKVFEEKTDMTEIRKINMSEQSGSNSFRWYSRGKYIVVDDTTQEDDIIIDYEGKASAITDIPDEYHEFLVSWCVQNLMELNPDARDYDEKVTELNIHRNTMDLVIDDINRTFKASSEPTKIRNVWT